LKNIDCSIIKKGRNESDDVYHMKLLLCKLGKKLGYEVDIEEVPESELGELTIRHDVIWYKEFPEWYKQLLKIILKRNDLIPEYKELIKKKLALKRELMVAFEIEGSDKMTKAMKGDISNLSKLPYGIIIVKRGKGSIENIRNRFEKALIEFRLLHGPNNVIVTSFEDIEELVKSFI